jgi:hypothetical protein
MSGPCPNCVERADLLRSPNQPQGDLAFIHSFSYGVTEELGMFSLLKAAWQGPAKNAPARSHQAGRLLSLTTLEDRTVPSAGMADGSTLLTGTPGGSGSQPATLTQTSGGPGPSAPPSTSGGSSSIGGSTSGGGPGYPLPPTTGPTPTGSTDPNPTPSAVLVPLCGTPGGPTVVVSPVVTV